MKRRTEVFFQLVALVLVVFWSSMAQASASYFSDNTGRCYRCHVDDVPTCAGCHAHATHSGVYANDLNLTAMTDKTTYVPGEAMVVRVTGGDAAGWVRVTLYDSKGTQLARSSGPCNRPDLMDGGCGGGQGFPGPIALSGRAPTVEGSYQYRASWYGNAFESYSGPFGPNWKEDLNNPGHGEEIVLTNVFQVKIPPVCTDADGDGFAREGGSCGPVDCNDSAAAVHPGAIESCTDGVDNDCDGLVDAADPDAVGCPPVCTDADGDGFAREGGVCGPVDCNDSEVAIHPEAAESCTDGIDNDCDGLVDAADPDAVGCPPVCTDADGDGFTREGGVCGPVDCNDGDAAIHPDAVESCTDGVDNDCDRLVDAADPDAVGCPPVCTDADGDGFAAEGGACGPADCNDSVAAVHPGAVESCTDGVDNDCDGLVDGEDPDAVGCLPVCTDADGDGFAVEGGDCGPADCNDSDAAVHPGAVESCTDGVDNDCDGLVDKADPDAVGCAPVCTDADGDGFAREGGDCGPVDCNDSVASIRPDAAESCTDGVDNDCDGLVDAADPDAVGCPPICTDADGDGFAREGGVCGPVDCNDADRAVSPGSPESCGDGTDNDCDGKVDRADPDCQTSDARYEIEQFHCSENAKIGDLRGRSVRVDLWVSIQNRGTSDPGAMLKVVGRQGDTAISVTPSDGVRVYDEPAKGKAKLSFTYKPEVSGTIEWQASLSDQGVVLDHASCTTSVRDPAREKDKDRDKDDHRGGDGDDERD